MPRYGDPTILFGWGNRSKKVLSEVGVISEFHQFHIGHEINNREIEIPREWVLKIFPGTVKSKTD